MNKKIKSDICDYIDWRGDLSFEVSPFNDVDALIFCQLSYINFTELAPKELDSSIKLADLSAVNQRLQLLLEFSAEIPAH